MNILNGYIRRAVYILGSSVQLDTPAMSKRLVRGGLSGILGRKRELQERWTFLMRLGGKISMRAIARCCGRKLA